MMSQQVNQAPKPAAIRANAAQSACPASTFFVGSVSERAVLAGKQVIGAVLLAARRWLSWHVAIALATCQESQRLAAKSTAPMTCFPANTARSLTEPTKKVDAGQALWAAFALIAAGFGAWFTCWLIIRYEHLHA